MAFKMLRNVWFVALATACALPAAAQTYNWTLSGLDSGSGTFVAGSAAGGGVNVLNFTGVINGHSVSEVGGQPGRTTVLPLSPAVNYPSIFYDNIIFTGNLRVLDGGGILMSYNGDYANIYSNSPTDYGFITNLTVDHPSGDLFSISQVTSVPEPASLAALGTGLVALGLLRRRKNAA